MFMPDMHLKKLQFAYSTCGSFTKNKDRIHKCKETGNSRYIYRNELDKACFHQDMVYGDFKDLAKRTAVDKDLRDKGFSVAKDSKYDGCQTGLASKVYTFFDRKTAGSGIKFIPKSEQLAEELHNHINRNFKRKRKKGKCFQSSNTILGVLK